jgi:predicted Fe-S protein YdhL (DUF1289 family)
MTKKNNERIVESPCVRNCCLNADDICLGCLRHLSEITGWQSFTTQEKIAVLVKCKERENNKLLD